MLGRGAQAVEHGLWITGSGSQALFGLLMVHASFELDPTMHGQVLGVGST